MIFCARTERGIFNVVIGIGDAEVSDRRRKVVALCIMESPNYVGFRALPDSSKKFLNRESEESRTDRIRKGRACINDTLTDPPAMLASVTEDIKNAGKTEVQ